MATRSIIGRYDATHTWIGTYVHWDGSPGSRLPELRRIINRAGIDVAMVNLIQPEGWSCINAEQVSVPGHSDRFAVIAGYGCLYRGDDALSSFVHAGDINHDLEYAYILTTHGGKPMIDVYDKMGANPNEWNYAMACDCASGKTLDTSMTLGGVA